MKRDLKFEAFVVDQLKVKLNDDFVASLLAAAPASESGLELKYVNNKVQLLWQAWQARQAEIDDLEKEVKRLKSVEMITMRALHNTITGNQAAWIAHKHEGAEKGIEWIENGLFCSGMLPQLDDPISKTAQDWYDYHEYDALAKRIETERKQNG